MGGLVRAMVWAGLIWWSSSASAVCIYNGRLYAKTTLRQEFRDSHWVARVRVLRTRNNWGRQAVYDGNEEAWSLYALKVEQVFKGKPPKMVTFFTERNSGGFYFDLPWKGADIGGEYLVFLNPIEPYAGRP